MSRGMFHYLMMIAACVELQPLMILIACVLSSHVATELRCNGDITTFCFTECGSTLDPEHGLLGMTCRGASTTDSLDGVLTTYVEDCSNATGK